jgi:hypothetical protein
VDEIDLTRPGEAAMGQDWYYPPTVTGPGYLTAYVTDDLTHRWRRVARWYVPKRARGWRRIYAGPHITERYVRWRFTPRKRDG